MSFDRAFLLLEDLEDQCSTCMAMGELRAELLALETKYGKVKKKTGSPER